MTSESTFHKGRACRKRAQLGKSSESLVEEVLALLKNNNLWFDYDRLPDTRAAGKMMPARASDFTVFCRGRSYSIEVKEVTGQSKRLERPRQLERMYRREQAGVVGWYLIHYKEEGVWFAVPNSWFWEQRETKASWKLLEEPGFDRYANAGVALAAAIPLCCGGERQ